MVSEDIFYCPIRTQIDAMLVKKFGTKHKLFMMKRDMQARQLHKERDAVYTKGVKDER